MSSKAKQPGQARSKGGQVWRVAAGKLELVAPAGGQAGNRPALVDQSPDGLSAEWEPVHPVQGASRAERATASSSPPIVVIDDDGCIRARVPRSCHRPTPARLPGPPGFRVLLGGSWPSWATSDSVSSSLTVWKRCPSSGVGTAPPQAEPAATWTFRWLLSRAVGGRGGGPLLQRLGLVGRGRPGRSDPSGFQLGGEGDA
jgi:hypothetical protein